MHVLVTGGAGYIGSVVTEKLIEDDHETVVLDNLVKGHRGAVPSGAKFVEGDIADVELLRRTFREHKTEAVIHMAAASLVGESVTNPAKYYRENTVKGLALLDAMLAENVRRIVFSSTAAVYGEPTKQPIEESDPTIPTNPYGASKLAFEQALRWYDEAYGLRYASLRYFNAAGATRERGEQHNPETHLIPLVLQAAAGTRAEVTVFGDNYATRDGTCVRDYIHVADLARAHILALEALGDGSRIYNLGCGGDGYTVSEVISAAEEVTGRRVPVKKGARRAGDPAMLVASSTRINRELGWAPAQGDLREIVRTAWDWMQSHPEGYEVKAEGKERK